MITIIDYGAGNLRSIQRAVNAAGAEAVITADLDEVAKADRLVLPGVGNAAAAMNRLRQSGMADLVIERANQGTPLLGVCLGMQLLFGDQEEGPTTGLDLLPGTVHSLPNTLKVPQMGWNLTTFRPESALANVNPAYFYFVHSYVARPTNEADIAGTTEYGISFPSVVVRDHIWGFQFHPEKSAEAGLALVKVWVDWQAA